MRPTQQMSNTPLNEPVRWLRETVGPAYDALKADPSRVVTAAQVRARLAEEYKRSSDKK